MDLPEIPGFDLEILKQHLPLLKNKHPGITSLANHGLAGYVFNTTDEKQILKVSCDPYEYALFDYALKHPHPALCPTYDLLKLGGMHCIWKKKLNMANYRQFAEPIYEFGALARKMDDWKPQAEVQKSLGTLKSAAHRILNQIPATLPLKELLSSCLAQNKLVQDLTLSNFGINVIDQQQVLCLLDGKLFELEP